MDKIKNLDFYQKALLIAMLAMALIFALIYPRTISKVGYDELIFRYLKCAKC